MPLPKFPKPILLTKAALGTLAFVSALVILSGLVTIAFSEMRRDANWIDDARAGQAARAAIKSFQSRLGATVRDNAIWDDAYLRMQSPAGAAWAYENWGKSAPITHYTTSRSS